MSLVAWGTALSTACGGPPEPAPPRRDLDSPRAAASGSTPHVPGELVRSGTPRVELEAITVQGDLSPKAIFRTVRERTPDFRRCYDDALKRRPNATGHVVVHFDITASGNVKDAIDAEQDMGDETMAECVGNAFRTLIFPRPNWGPIGVVFPILFAP